MAYIKKAVKLDPEASNIVDTWGWGLYKSGRYEEALAALNKAWEMRCIWATLYAEQIRTVAKALAGNVN